MSFFFIIIIIIIINIITIIIITCIIMSIFSRNYNWFGWHDGKLLNILFISGGKGSKIGEIWRVFLIGS